MHLLNKLVPAACLLVIPAISDAQVSVIGITKTAYYHQTAPTNQMDVGSGFLAFIEGNNLTSSNPSGPRTVTDPKNIVHTFVFDLDGWFYETNFTSRALLNSTLPSGLYILRMAGKSVSLTQTGDAFPVIPIVFTSAGKWINGRLQITTREAAAGFWLQSNTSDGNGFVTGEIFGENNTYELFVSDETGFASVRADIPPGALVEGGIYHVEFEFDNVTDSVSASTIAAGAMAYALYSSNTGFEIEVVPEPNPFLGIRAQPQGRTIAIGDVLQLNVLAAGLEPFAYQWRLNGTNVPGATNASLVISNAQAIHAGSYLVAVSNLTGSVLSAPAIVQVLAPPRVTVQPVARTVARGATATFSVTATGSAPLSYQWQLNGENLRGATNNTLTVTNIQAAQAGSYTVAVANRVGATNSAVTPLKVTLPVIRLADAFTNRVLTNLTVASFVGTNATATREPGEPNHAGKPGGRSVWLSWQAPGDGTATFNTSGSGFDTLLAIYTGTNLTTLTRVTADDDGGGFLASKATFAARAGTIYQIAVDGLGGASGPVVLSWQFEFGNEDVPQITTAPQSQTVVAGANVTFAVLAAARAITGYQWFFKGAAIPGATGPSLTLSNVQAGAAGIYTVQVSTSSRSVVSPPAVLEIGPAAIATSTDKFEDLFLDTVPGATLQSIVSRRKSGFASVSAGVLGTQVMDNFGAGKQPGEPNHGGVIGGASRWFRIKAADAGVMIVDTIGSEVDTVLAVYSGTNLLTLQVVASDNDSASDGLRSLVRFAAARDREYVVAVDAVNAAQGAIRLNWKLGDPPRIVQSPSNVSVPMTLGTTLSVVSEGTPSPVFQWRFNGLDIPGATGAVLVLNNVQLTNQGSYRVEASNFVGSAVSGAALLTVTPAPLRFVAPLITSDRLFRFQVTGASQSSYLIEASTNLVNWLPISTNVPQNGALEFTDALALPWRFYRARPGG